jgi:hypothetical protein
MSASRLYEPIRNFEPPPTAARLGPIILAQVAN